MLLKAINFLLGEKERFVGRDKPELKLTKIHSHEPQNLNLKIRSITTIG